MISRDQLVDTACGLLSEDGENTEYDRAVIEMVTELCGLSMDYKECVAIILRAPEWSLVEKSDRLVRIINIADERTAPPR